MKTIAKVLSAAATLVALSGTASAAPMLYTFEGNVSSVCLGNSSGYGSCDPSYTAAGYTAGSLVSYTALLDFGQQASYTNYGGSTYQLPDNPSLDYFHADYVSGSAIIQNAGPYNGMYNVAEHNIGYDYWFQDSFGNNYYQGLLHLNSDSDQLQISKILFDDPSALVSNWAIGTQVYGFNQVYLDPTDAASWIQISSNLQLTSITPVNPVPEPSTMLLLGGGLAGLWFARKRFKS